MIDKFEKEYFFLSNFYRENDNTTVEHRYQAAKAKNPEDYNKIISAESPAIAKKLGRSIEIREDWEFIKYHIMKSLVMFKFLSDPVLLEKLLNTDNKKLIEGNTWHDNTWGNCQCNSCSKKEGKNWLGEILMDVRDKARVCKQNSFEYQENCDINKYERNLMPKTIEKLNVITVNTFEIDVKELKTIQDVDNWLDEISPILDGYIQEVDGTWKKMILNQRVKHRLNTYIDKLLDKRLELTK